MGGICRNGGAVVSSARHPRSEFGSWTVWHGKTRVPLAFAIGALITTAVLAQVPTVGGTWETLAPMPDRRTEVSVTTDGEACSVLGGFTPRLVGASAPLPVYSYDPATDTWSRLTDLPDGVSHAGLVYLDGSLYVVGGYRRATFRPVDRLMIYGLAGGEWREGPPLPTARGALAVAVLDGRIHAMAENWPMGTTPACMKSTTP